MIHFSSFLFSPVSSINMERSCAALCCLVVATVAYRIDEQDGEVRFNEFIVGVDSSGYNEEQGPWTRNRAAEGSDVHHYSEQCERQVTGLENRVFCFLDQPSYAREGKTCHPEGIGSVGPYSNTSPQGRAAIDLVRRGRMFPAPWMHQLYAKSDGRSPAEIGFFTGLGSSSSRLKQAADRRMNCGGGMFLNPHTRMGVMINQVNELDACGWEEFSGDFWVSVSRAYTRENGAQTLRAFVNKNPSDLQRSIFYRFELAAIAEQLIEFPWFDRDLRIHDMKDSTLKEETHFYSLTDAKVHCGQTTRMIVERIESLVSGHDNVATVRIVCHYLSPDQLIQGVDRYAELASEYGEEC